MGCVRGEGWGREQGQRYEERTEAAGTSALKEIILTTFVLQLPGTPVSRHESEPASEGFIHLGSGVPIVARDSSILLSMLGSPVCENYHTCFFAPHTYTLNERIARSSRKDRRLF